ncbi:MAG: precorrin-8X methylmutase [Dehalococcoidia bacterium]|jgi:precorrin-8X/cobalt-precorrin-8 methylmutase|nr:precorrin-8X methylmutase [Dehalococcoidia bacterium]MDP6227754.1 precorrin-8X methylmutase [Dehalococcoidia bacterium]MDP7084008.1 precorrin-8X methylmutase [Dehalococcoidia bacterium]MDP7199891.1 precorrin-8X methylmutase [Dehalococcoidia bacterium]HJN85681.1 precorrin-8X methylmutase [Dehalococcoidia bacterium]
MSLVEKYALLPDEIDRESFRRVEASLPDSLSLSPDERYLVCRIVRAEGDPEIARAVRFSPGAVERGVAALQTGAQVITDVRMVEVGISKALLSSRRVSTRCAIATPEVAARAQKDGTTRSVAAMRELAPYMDGAVVAVGNAPTALLAVLDLVNEGLVAPALVIGMPVGFVACAESKEELLRSSVPHICIEEYRGGSSAAAATVNTLLSLTKEADTP